MTILSGEGGGVMTGTFEYSTVCPLCGAASVGDDAMMYLCGRCAAALAVARTGFPEPFDWTHDLLQRSCAGIVADLTAHPDASTGDFRPCGFCSRMSDYRMISPPELCPHCEELVSRQKDAESARLSYAAAIMQVIARRKGATGEGTNMLTNLMKNTILTTVEYLQSTYLRWAMEVKKHAMTKLRPDTIILAGFSRLPEKMTAKNSNGFMSVELELDPKDNKVVDFNCSVVSLLVEKVLNNALLGFEIEEGVRECISQIETRHYSVTKRALIAALEDVFRNYQMYANEKETVAKKQ